MAVVSYIEVLRMPLCLAMGTVYEITDICGVHGGRSAEGVYGDLRSRKQEYEID